jgi:cob(I)alamin adenosyltransferase
VPKSHPRVAAYGSVDELNSLIGLLLTHQLPDSVTHSLRAIQHDLFDLGGELCIPGHSVIRGEQIRQLERTLDQFNGELAPLQEFILPGGTAAAAICHLARTVCRRAERGVVALDREEEGAIRPESLHYLNRLSDLLFVMARTINRWEGKEDVLWDRTRFAAD